MPKPALTRLKSQFAAALVAAAACFAVSQILISAHAAKYGDGPHKHNGQVCVLSLVAHHNNKLIASASFVLAVFIAVWRASDVVAQTERARIVVRAAQPRGPPSL